MRCASPPDSVAGRARQREVVEADVEQEAEPRLDLLEHLRRDRALALAQLEAVEERARLADRQRQTSAIDLPPTCTASTSGLSRAPSHTGHGTSRM